VSTLPWRRWAFAIVPALGILELVAHIVQTRATVDDKDWSAARDYVVGEVRPADLVAFAPRWVDPLGRQHFGAEIATLEREARADETRFPRALEVSIRGTHLPAFARWRRTAERRFGGVSVTTWENPTPATVIDDLVSMVGPRTMRVSLVAERARESDCPFVHTGAQSGGLGYGPAIPGDRFVCPGGGFVAASVVADLDYVPHRCIYAPPVSGGAVRIRFLGVRLGTALHGHHALYVEAERQRKGAPVTVLFSAGESTLGSLVHQDGDGWKPFEFDTSELAGQRTDVVVEVRSPSVAGRMYCFEADTR
jgi:hypothetical protein